MRSAGLTPMPGSAWPRQGASAPRQQTTLPILRRPARATFALADGDWTFTYAPALDPLCGRGWPVIAGGQAQRVVDAIPQEQLDALPLGRLDFIGMNITTPSSCAPGQTASRNSAPGRRTSRTTAIGWPITPESMEWGTRFIWERSRSAHLHHQERPFLHRQHPSGRQGA